MKWRNGQTNDREIKCSRPWRMQHRRAPSRSQGPRMADTFLFLLPAVSTLIRLCEHLAVDPEQLPVTEIPKPRPEQVAFADVRVCRVGARFAIILPSGEAHLLAIQPHAAAPLEIGGESRELGQTAQVWPGRP